MDCPLIVEVFGGIACRGWKYLKYLDRRAQDKKRGRDSTAYSRIAGRSGEYLSLHMRRISGAAVPADAAHTELGNCISAAIALATASPAFPDAV